MYTKAETLNLFNELYKFDTRYGWMLFNELYKIRHKMGTIIETRIDIIY